MLYRGAGERKGDRSIDASVRQAILHGQRAGKYRDTFAPSFVHTGRVAVESQVDIQYNERERFRGIRSGFQHR